MNPPADLIPNVIFRHLEAHPDIGQVICQLGGVADLASTIFPPGKLLPLLGSMGMVLPVGLGVALASSKKVIAIEGDGGLLMCLGTLATIVKMSPENLLCVILDNNGYQTTGGQPTSFPFTNGIRAFFEAAGFKHIRSIKECNETIDAISWGMKSGLRALICHTSPIPETPFSVDYNPAEVAKKFMQTNMDS